MDFPAPASQEVATKPTRLVHPSSWLPQLQYRFFRTKKLKSQHKTNTFCPITQSAAGVEDAGGRKRAWPQCRWAAAGPGRASRRHAQPHVSRPGIAGVEDAGGTGGHGCGAVGGGRACPGIKMTLGADQHARPHWCEGRRRGLAGHISDTAPKRRRCGGCRRAQERLAAVPVAGGGAWPGFAATRRAKLAAQTARGRAAAHRHTQRPGPTTRPGLKDKKSWWRVSPSCFGGGLCGGGRARRWRRPIWG